MPHAMSTTTTATPQCGHMHKCTLSTALNALASTLPGTPAAGASSDPGACAGETTGAGPSPRTILAGTSPMLEGWAVIFYGTHTLFLLHNVWWATPSCQPRDDGRCGAGGERRDEGHHIYVAQDNISGMLFANMCAHTTLHTLFCRGCVFCSCVEGSRIKSALHFALPQSQSPGPRPAPLRPVYRATASRDPGTQCRRHPQLYPQFDASLAGSR